MDGRTDERAEAFVVARPLQGLGLLCGFRERREGEGLNALGHFSLPSILSNCAHRNPSQTRARSFFVICSVTCTDSQGGNKRTEESGQGDQEFIAFMNDSLFLRSK